MTDKLKKFNANKNNTQRNIKIIEDGWIKSDTHELIKKTIDKSTPHLIISSEQLNSLTYDIFEIIETPLSKTNAKNMVTSAYIVPLSGILNKQIIEYATEKRISVNPVKSFVLSVIITLNDSDGFDKRNIKWFAIAYGPRRSSKPIAHPDVNLPR